MILDLIYYLNPWTTERGEGCKTSSVVNNVNSLRERYYREGRVAGRASERREFVGGETAIASGTTNEREREREREREKERERERERQTERERERDLSGKGEVGVEDRGKVNDVLRGKDRERRSTCERIRASSPGSFLLVMPTKEEISQTRDSPLCAAASPSYRRRPLLPFL
eukprot:scaffold6579_cov23-Tisochrysis_lutea.AAC.1